ncbi:hypothetical protein LTR36_000865 [Oleoguttula mirabilis]|uniref:Uncharacterized protein n=1 Tax=Oleoguttula mirabilis TaxID=1507867 RepID=A0AAV9J2Z6_9PEZI|nr:hypothetical protein LTR36_000865 [Oleoguttula mirabilis]
MQGMESIHSQADFGHRTADFFDDDTSEDEAANIAGAGGDALDLDLLGRRRSAIKRRQHRPTSEPFVTQCEGPRAALPSDAVGYQRLAPNTQQEEHIRFADTPSSSFNGSVDELLPHNSSPPRGRTPHKAARIERPGEQQAPVPLAKNEQLLAAHAIAHEITLQALMRDGDVLDGSLHSFTPLEPGHRASLLPPSLRTHDPRSPRTHAFASPESATSKKAHVVPPPIDTSGPRHSLPADLVRTPYPYTPDKVHHKDFGRSPPAVVPSIPPTTESVLTLGIRRCNRNSMRKVTSLTIPASNDFSAIRSYSGGEKERPFKAIDFDDAEFFRQLRACYRELSGPMRFLSARSLARIAVSGPASKAADAGYGWIHQPRSPRVLAYRGLSDTFSEEKILQHYRKPVLGRSRYAFVHWAHRLAAAPPVRTPQADDNIEATVERDLVRRMEQPEGLEFVVSWSISRILLALLLVLVVSTAAALLWIFLGKNTTGGQLPHGGFRDAGDRVSAGVVMGICILLLGLSGIAGWLGISWLAM